MTTVVREARVSSVPGLADVWIAGASIAAVQPAGSPSPEGCRAGEAQEIHAGGRVLMPAFVDAHTHACWAGDRLDEWERKLEARHASGRLGGEHYLDLLAAGGGIMATVRAVRAATEEALEEALLERLDRMLAEGTTTVEVKSGYGLSTGDELKMLRAIERAGRRWRGTVVATACIGHAIDGPHDAFVERTLTETLGAVHAAFPGVAIDAYCEDGAWTLRDCVRLFERARALGHPGRVHADQFHELGMVAEAVRLGLRSADHLEVTSGAALEALAASDLFGVMLPASSFHMGGGGGGGGPHGDGRRFLDAGGHLVLATNLNPGSSPCLSMPQVVALGVRLLGLQPAEAVAAVTAEAARLLGFDDRGVVAPGKRADLILLHHRDPRALAFELGGRPVARVICGGALVA